MVGTKGAAKESALAALHETLAVKLKDTIENGETVTRGETEVVVPVSAAVLAVARAFLRDNSIECDPDKPGAVADLGETMQKHLDKEENSDEIPKFVN